MNDGLGAFLVVPRCLTVIQPLYVRTKQSNSPNFMLIAMESRGSCREVTYTKGEDSGQLEITVFLYQVTSLFIILFTPGLFVAFASSRQLCEVATKTTAHEYEIYRTANT